MHVAEEGRALVGFACVFLDEHPVWGALLDNLHVIGSHQSQGLGRRLLAAAAASCGGGMHLLVFEGNSAACRFYERLGAREIERIIVELPGGGTTVSVRYGWPSATAMPHPIAR